MIQHKSTSALAAIAAANQEEAQWLAKLTAAGASIKDKSDACRELGRCGGAASVEPLAALLTDEKLSHMARYGLEPITDPGVNEALRNAMDLVGGELLAGVIGSLGVRGDVQAVDAIAKELRNRDDLVAQAAARALGSIGTPEAGRALARQVKRASGQNLLAACEGAMRCAESLAAHGNQAQANELYEAVAESDAPVYVVESAQASMA